MQEVAATRKEKSDLLKNRARRLQFFVHEFNGRQNRIIENEAYLLLETFEKRHRAIWRYIKFALKEWLKKWRFKIEFTALFFWYRLVKGIERGRAIDLAHDVVEERIGG